ncbi:MULTISPECIES: hypothetical protein [Rhizobium/Agrobacterium group]|uniref:hypothetical protein n=1 Tax=Rhizobium/Agrobacterium group TaxID=227290 RepID=UPI0022C4472F|nr:MULTISPECIES: hypothetical protein [Rhizobium/Agrobacterium group]MCZ7479979.1 hypothetical protein [Rhizobium rhizogenes]MDO3442890.1 hypothetical protein [Agrobacterium sp. V1]
MDILEMKKITRTTISFSMLAVTLSLSGCMSPEEQRRADSNTCADFGTRYGSPTYTQCMLQQQHRRDQEQLIAAESMRATSETSLNNLEMMRRLREGKR